MSKNQSIKKKQRREISYRKRRRKLETIEKEEEEEEEVAMDEPAKKKANGLSQEKVQTPKLLHLASTVLGSSLNAKPTEVHSSKPRTNWHSSLAN